MVLRMSRLMLKTLRDAPADAETASHRLLVRAGYVRRSSAGVWIWLPLGKRVLDNVARVVREEMEAIGGLIAGRRAPDGILELNDRRTGAREELPLAAALTRLTRSSPRR